MPQLPNEDFDPREWLAGWWREVFAAANGGQPKGVWVARYPDHSGAVPFPTEIEALRHATTHYMEAVWVPFGEDVFSPFPGTDTTGGSSV